MANKTPTQVQDRAPHHLIAYVGVISALYFAFSVALGRDFVRIGEALLILSLLFSIKNIYHSNTKQDNRLYLLAIVFFIFMLLVNKWAEITYVNDDLNHHRFMKHYIRLFLFLVIGWWLYKNEQLVVILFCCLVLGFLMKVSSSGDLLQWDRILSGHRMDYGFSNAQHTGLYAGSVVLTTLFLYSKALKIPRLPLNMLAQGLLLSALIISLICVVSSQTRGVLIGLAVALFIFFTAWIIRSPLVHKIGIKKSITVSVLVVVFGMLLVMKYGSIETRLQTAIQTVTTLAAEGIENTPTTSSGIRLHQWDLALKLIVDRPLLGYGGATKEQLIQQSEMPRAAINGFGHFHNSYLELGVAYGIGAIAIFLYLLYFLTRRLLIALEQRQVCPTFVYMGLSWLIFFSICNLFESYVMYRSGYMLFAVIGGAIYGLSIPTRQNDE